MALTTSRVISDLSYLRDRLVLARELLSESGSIFVQISDENVHLVRNLLDEIFGVKNFCAQINFKSTSALGQKGLAKVYDYIVWYCRDIEKFKFRPLFKDRDIKNDTEWRFIDDQTEKLGYRKLTEKEFASLQSYEGVFRRYKLTSSGFTPTCIYNFEFNNTICKPFGGKSWVTTQEGMKRLIEKNRLFLLGGSPYFKQYYKDFPVIKYDNSWGDQPAAESRLYVVETAKKFIQRCLLMATDPGDLVFDPTCGSGTTAVVAEQWGRRWITCDTSRVAITLTKQRLMTENFKYYELAKQQEGVSSGFRYNNVPHVTLKSIANNEPPATETLYDDPLVDTSKIRVTSPFTVEAVPAPTVQALHEVEVAAGEADASIARSGETVRQSELRDELLRTGIRGRQGERLRFSRVEPMSGTRFLHADAELISEDGDEPSRAVISFSPEHFPLGQIQVARALEEANRMFPKPKFVIFAAYQFDPEAAQDIEETNWSGVQLLKAEINKDLQTQDLKKKRSSNESFWLIGQPDVQLRQAGKNEIGERLYQVEVLGFDYYDTKEGKIISGSADHIAVWLLDTDYDGRSIFPHQVFFPMAGDKEGWAKLAKNLKAQIDEELIEAYRGKVSLPFAAGENKRAAVKIVDDRGIESIKLIDLQ